MSFRGIPAHQTGRARLGRAAGTRLSGRRLILTRLAWIVLVVCILGYFIASLPQTFVTLHQPCIGVWCTNATGRLTASQMHSLLQAGISLDAYAWSFLVFTGVTALVWFGVGGILFWRFPENGLYLIQGQAILYTLALFPNGRSVPRWSFWVTLVNPTYVVCYLLFLRPQRVPGWALFNNPINAVAWFGSWAVLTLAQIYRYFRVSNAVERQQTKWVALGFFVVLVGSLVEVSLGDNLSTQHNGLLYALGNFGFPLILLLLPLSIGLAMLRSHLWDIDIIINKALVYGLLTALLAAVYTGLVLGLQALLGGLLHQTNAITLVISTLAIYALFQPLRHRIQAIIDRRFYRRKYDAAKIVAAYSATLRQEVDLDQLREHLVAVVQETMQPTSVSLWLRPPAHHGTQQVLWRANPSVPSEDEAREAR